MNWMAERRNNSGCERKRTTFAWFINVQHGWVMPGAPWYLAAVMLFGAMALAFTVEQPELRAAPVSPPAPEGS